VKNINIKPLLEKLKNRPFFKNVLTLSFGTGLAHGLSFISQFALIKLFAPEEIGIVARFVAVVSILSIVFTARYEQAIVLPKDEEKSKHLVYISLIINTLFTIVLIVPLAIFPTYLGSLLDLTVVRNWLWLLPITAWFMAGYNILFYWFNRKSEYKLMANSKMIENGGRASIQIGAGFMALGAMGLIFGRIAGHALAFGYFFRKCRTELAINLKSYSFNDLKKTAKEYIHFPKHLLVSQGISALYFQFPVLFLGWKFGDDIVGFFSTANMFVGIPGILIARAVGDVFRQRATELYNESGKFNYLVIQTLKNTFFIGLVPFILIIWLSPVMLEWYQPEWKSAGIYMSILAVSGFFSFVITPIDKASLVVQNTKYIFYWHLSRFLFNVLICVVVNYFEISPVHYLWMLVAVDLLHYGVELFYNYTFSLGK
jgi:O-antigen/teichoic acid export membrane protein